MCDKLIYREAGPADDLGVWLVRGTGDPGPGYPTPALRAALRRMMERSEPAPCLRSYPVRDGAFAPLVGQPASSPGPLHGCASATAAGLDPTGLVLTYYASAGTLTYNWTVTKP